jgi:hypothetical protein
MNIWLRCRDPVRSYLKTRQWLWLYKCQLDSLVPKSNYLYLPATTALPTTTSQPFSYFHFISLYIYLNLNNNKKNRLLLLAVLFSVRVRSIQFNHQSTVICFCWFKFLSNYSWIIGIIRRRRRRRWLFR